MFIELSYPIGPETTVLDAAVRPPEVKVRSRMSEGKQNNSSYIELFAHAGTHIDAPWHFNDGGWRIMDFEVGDFVFSNVLQIDAPAQPWQPIPLERFQPYAAEIGACDALLIRSGFS
ncbi:MAG: cyclase family protein, partial [Anaerolineales bacterium]|nr:cyclase family protein [Anaerolineales bacterium]